MNISSFHLTLRSSSGQKCRAYHGQIKYGVTSHYGTNSVLLTYIHHCWDVKHHRNTSVQIFVHVSNAKTKTHEEHSSIIEQSHVLFPVHDSSKDHKRENISRVLPINET